MKGGWVFEEIKEEINKLPETENKNTETKKYRL